MALDGDDDQVIIRGEGAYTDDENFYYDFLNVETFPQEVASVIEIMENYRTEEILDSSNDLLINY